MTTVSASVLAAIITLLGTLFLGQLYVTLWTWRHTASLGGDDEERVVELQSYQRSVLDEEITQLFIKIDKKVDSGGDLPRDMRKKDHVANVINREIGEDDIEPVVNELDSVDVPDSLFDEHKESYKSASWNFLVGALLTLGLSGAIAAATVYEGEPFSGVYPFIYFLFAVGIFQSGYDGINNFREAQNLKDEFESIWREYKRVD
ncbi:hypothetical protein [Halorubrum saccharovorum]|uniref:hypothetical protein n=1 Tax=Halorubrum saccharovorum TaxID=2248 RepID=UPI00128B4E1B|nr:hypothetical protein [Halorubrum saccharovorum]